MKGRGTYDFLRGILWPNHVVPKQQLSDHNTCHAEDNRYVAGDLGWGTDKVTDHVVGVGFVTGHVVDARDS